MSNIPTSYVYPEMQIVWMRGQSGNNGYWLPGQDQGQGQQRWTLVPGLEEVACGLNVKYGSAPTGPNAAHWCCLLHTIQIQNFHFGKISKDLNCRIRLINFC